jgi:putative endonuclease
MNTTGSSLWEVYIIKTESGKLYTGITNNLARRFLEHKRKKKGARFFHFSSPKRVVFRQGFANRSEATKQEIAIKKMSLEEKLALIGSAKKKKESVSHD